MKRKPGEAIAAEENSIEIKLAVARWKVITGRTQQQLAEELGIPPSYLCQILNGVRPGRQYVPRITQITRKFAS